MAVVMMSSPIISDQESECLLDVTMIAQRLVPRKIRCMNLRATFDEFTRYTIQELDYPLARNWGGELERTTTIAREAERCDFRWYNRLYRRVLRLGMKSFRLGIAFWVSIGVAVSAQSSAPALPPPPPILAPSGQVQAYVNSGGLRLRDFPGIADGVVLRLFPKGAWVKVHAITQWKDRIGGEDYPWYEVTPVDDPTQSGWVFGQYLTFETGNPLESVQIETVSRQHMNRVLLVHEIFRKLLHTNTISVPASWTSTHRPLSGPVPGGSILAASPLRIYETRFGTVEISIASQTGEYPVFAVTVSKPTAGLLLSIGDQEVRLANLFGSDFYSVGSARQYRYSPFIDTYAVSIVIIQDKVSSIQIGALME